MGGCAEAEEFGRFVHLCAAASYTAETGIESTASLRAEKAPGRAITKDDGRMRGGGRIWTLRSSLGGCSFGSTGPMMSTKGTPSACATYIAPVSTAINILSSFISDGNSSKVKLVAMDMFFLFFIAASVFS